MHRKLLERGILEIIGIGEKKKKRISGGCALGEMKSVILFKTFLLVNLFSCAIFIQALGIEGCLYCL